nr:hypothetical protein [Tanacetum cinerariifolium]
MSNINNTMQNQTSSVLHNERVFLFLTSKLQEKARISKEGCIKSLRAIQLQFKFLTDTLQDFGSMPIFKRTFAQDLDLLDHHLTKEIISQTDCKTILTKLGTTFENAFNSEFKERMQKYKRFDAQSFKDAMICNMDSIEKYMLEIIPHQQQISYLLKLKKLMQTQEDHSNLIQALNIDSLKVDLVVIQNTCSEKEDANSETASSKSVKESSLDSTTKDVHAIKYKMEMQTQESKIDTGKVVNDDLVVTESSRIESEVQDDNSMSGNDTDADDVDIRPIYDEEPMAEVQLTAELCLNANHDACITKLLKEVNSHTKIQSHKTKNNNKPVEQKSHSQKPNRQIFTGHRFSPNKASAVYEKTSPRSYLMWKPTCRIFKFVGLRWIPTRKLFDSCTSKVDSEPPHGSNVDILNIYECKQTLDVSAGTSTNVQKEQSLDLSACTLCNVNKENLRYDNNSICSGGGGTAVGGGDGNIDDGSNGEGDLDLLRDDDGQSNNGGEDDDPSGIEISFPYRWVKARLVGRGRGKGKEAEHDHLKVNKDDKVKRNVHDIQNRLGKLEVDLARAIKARQVDDHDDDLDTLDLENRIKKLKEDFEAKKAKKKELKPNEEKKAKKAELKTKEAKETMLAELEAKKAKEAKEAMFAEVVQISSDEDDYEDPTASTFTRSRALIASTFIPHAASTAPRYVLALFAPNASPPSATRKRKST